MSDGHLQGLSSDTCGLNFMGEEILLVDCNKIGVVVANVSAVGVMGLFGVLAGNSVCPFSEDVHQLELDKSHGFKHKSFSKSGRFPVAFRQFVGFDSLDAGFEDL